MTFVEPILKSQDLDHIQKLGRRFMMLPPEFRAQALREAADFIQLGTPEERERLYIWWEEGVRNTAKSQGHVNDANSAIRDQVRFNDLYNN